MDFGRKAQFFTMDVISKIAYGAEFGYLKQDEDLFGYIKTIEDLLVYMTYFSAIPMVNSILNRGWFKEKFGTKPEDTHGMGMLMRVAKKIVDARSDDTKEPKDMLDIFIRNGVPKRRLASEVLLQFSAGSDTTVTAIRSTFLYIITHSRVLNKLRAEFDDAESKGVISDPITYNEARNLPYLHAIVLEGLRIHPPLTTLLMKEVPSAGDTIKGYYIPGGTRVGFNFWALQWNEVFGEDVDTFRPERWLNIDEEKFKKMEQILELTFGYGRWQCLEKTVAFMELHKVFAQLLRQFDFEVINAGQPWKSTNYLFSQQHDMWLRVSERKRS